MTSPATPRSLAGRLWHDRRGVSAVEFAMVAPLMLLLYAGSSELSEALTVDRKTNKLASTVTDLVTQQQTINATKVTGILDAATAVMQPYDPSIATILVLAVDVNPDGTQTVNWSSSKKTGKPMPGTTSPIAIPAEIAVPGSQVIVSQVTYSYTSPFSAFMKTITGFATYNYDQVFMARPRLGNTIPWTN